MIRMAVSGVLGFILIFIESLIVMHFKGYETIDFGGMSSFIGVWSMNFFLVFAILTQLTNWYEEKIGFEEGNEDNSF